MMPAKVPVLRSESSRWESTTCPVVTYSRVSLHSFSDPADGGHPPSLKAVRFHESLRDVTSSPARPAV